MDKKVTGIIAYLTLIGWLIAYLAGDKEGAKFHLNQGLVLAICNIANVIVGMIPLIGGILSSIISIIILIFAILGIVYAAQDQDKELPIIGSIKILK